LSNGRLTYCHVFRSACAAVLAMLLALNLANPVSADILADAQNFERDNVRSAELAQFEISLCKAKGMDEVATLKCISDACREIQRKIPNYVVGFDLFVDHIDRSIKIARLMSEGKLTRKQADTAKKDSQSIHDAQLARRKKEALDYIASLDQRRGVSDEASAIAKEKARQDKFNRALGELGLQMMQPRSKRSGSNSARPVGCSLVGEQEDMGKRVCMYECASGPFALNVGFSMCPMRP